MDISLRTPEGGFNLRAGAVILHNGRLLAVRDEYGPNSYLPGGRVQLHETAESAILRELREELGVEARIIRPLWLMQNFFTWNYDGKRYHEVGLYFLADVSDAGLPEETFTRQENGHTLTFTWIPVDELQERAVYPLSITRRVHNLPPSLDMLICTDDP